MCRPCSSMRSCGPRPLAPLPPSRQPCWYRVMLSYRFRQPGRLSSMAAVIPATPPPRITTRGSGFFPAPSSPNGSLPEDVAQLHEKVELEPERDLRPARVGNSELAGDGLSVERRDGDAVVVRQQPAVAELQDLQVDEDEGLVARRAGHVRVPELLEQQHRRVHLDQVAEEQDVRDDVGEGVRALVEQVLEPAEDVALGELG